MKHTKNAVSDRFNTSGKICKLLISSVFLIVCLDLFIPKVNYYKILKTWMKVPMVFLWQRERKNRGRGGGGGGGGEREREREKRERGKEKNHLYREDIMTEQSDWLPHLMPWDQRCLLRRMSILTSGVPIIFSAKRRISLIARGALFLNPLQTVHSLSCHAQWTPLFWTACLLLEELKYRALQVQVHIYYFS